MIKIARKDDTPKDDSYSSTVRKVLVVNNNSETTDSNPLPMKLTNGTTDAIIYGYGGLVKMRYVRYLIYDGKYFICNDYESNVGTGVSKEYLIKTPVTEDIHIEYKLNATKETYLSIYENSSISANGSQMTSFNANRTSLTTSNASFFKGPTIVSDGTKLIEYATAWAIPIRAENSMVLKRNEEYLFRITSYEDNNKISLQYFFHP